VSTNKVKAAYVGILLFGLVSLLGDVIYEGARGIASPYLEYLGASAFLVGLTFGLGDFLGYALRLVSGYLADTTRAYWAFFLAGYALLISIPLLGVAKALPIAVLLILVERFAKALRSPARDTLLSVVSSEVGAGKAFGLHELMDQVGAVVGPAIVSAVLFSTGEYSLAFLALLFPYLLLVAATLTTYAKLKSVSPAKGEKRSAKGRKLPLSFKLYCAAVMLNTMGLVPIALMLYEASYVLAAWLIPLAYLAAQLVDAVSALFAGYAYDKVGRAVLLVPFALSIVPSVLAVVGGLEHLVAAILTFGVVYGMQESVYRAAVSDLTPVEVRGTSYGIFNSICGLGFLASGAVFGYFIEVGATSVAIAYAIAMEVAALSLLLKSLPKS